MSHELRTPLNAIIGFAQLMHDAKVGPVSPDHKAPLILVIEDNEEDQKWLAKILSDAGYAVEIATTGAEAIAKAETTAYSMILLDLILPDMAGWDAVHAIRATSRNREVPVIEFLDHFRQIGQCREVPVIVWTNKDITADERDQLKLSAQSVVLKCRNGIEDVIGELQRHLPLAIASSSSASAAAVENPTTHLKRHEETSLT